MMTLQPEQSQTGTRSTGVAHPSTAYEKQQFFTSSIRNRLFLRNRCAKMSTIANVSVIEWDYLDGLWTPKQRRLLEEGGGPTSLHATLTILLNIVIICSILLNTGILYVFHR